MEEAGIMLSAIVGSVSIFICLIATYISVSYGTYLLAKKYEPSLHPALSWIPILQIYPFVKVSGQSPWWILGFFVPILNIFAIFYINYGVAKRTGRDVGTMLLLTFFSFISVLWLGLTVHGKKTGLAWLLGIIAILGYIVGMVGIIGSIAGAAVSTGMDPEARQQIMESIRNNPEIQKAYEDLQNNPKFKQAIDEIKNNPEAMRAMEEAMKNNPDMKASIDNIMMNTQAEAEIKNN